MGALRKTHQRSKRNPYAERGLDKFALLSAELEEKREKLVAQLGNSLSIVRFEVGSGNHKWIPVIACPTLSSTEICILKGTAARLINAEAKPANSYAKVYPSAISHKESDMHASNITSKDAMILAHADQPPAHKSDTHAEDARTCHQTGSLMSRLLAASERFLWMAGFIFSITVDILRSALFLKWHVADVAASPSRLVRSYSSWRPKETTNHSCASMSSSLPSIHTPASMPSSTQSTYLPLMCTPASMPADGITVMDASPSPPHDEAHKVRNRCKSEGLSSSPSTPRDSRQGKKSLQASVSFPAMMRVRDEVPRSSVGMTKDSKFVKSVSLPNTSTQTQGLFRLQTMLRSPVSMTRETAELKKARKERSQNLGQALTGAGLALGLGGLVVGFIPAIVCIVCWWYGLPRMRRAVGDKPHVKSHHLSK